MFLKGQQQPTKSPPLHQYQNIKIKEEQAVYTPKYKDGVLVTSTWYHTELQGRAVIMSFRNCYQYMSVYHININLE